MNTGQTMLTIVAMILLSTVILTVNRNFLTTNTTMNEDRVDIIGVSVANSIIESASKLAFDENTASTSVSSTSALTASNRLGLDGTTEDRNDPTTFDDFDDYNCYRTNPKLDTIAVPGSANNNFYFTSYCSVDYVNTNSPDVISTSQTYNKRLSVKVFSPGMTDTVKMSTIFSYWYFR